METIDLNEQLVINAAHTEYFRMTGDAMENAGIGTGDVVVLDKLLQPESRDLVVAMVKGHLCVRRYDAASGTLYPGNAKYANIEKGQYAMYGVVTAVIKLFRIKSHAWNETVEPIKE